MTKRLIEDVQKRQAELEGAGGVLDQLTALAQQLPGGDGDDALQGELKRGGVRLKGALGGCTVRCLGGAGALAHVPFVLVSSAQRFSGEAGRAL